MCRVCECHRGGIVVMDVIWRRLYVNMILEKGVLFVLSWARVRRVRRGSISSELPMCGGGERSILLLPHVVRCLETIDVYGACVVYVRCRDCVGVCGNVCCVAAVVKKIFFSLGVLKYVVCLCRGCD